MLGDIAILQRTLNRLRRAGLAPKGVYRFVSHEEADERMIGDGEVARYGVVRVADEVVVDFIASACGITFDEAIAGSAREQMVRGR